MQIHSIVFMHPEHWLKVLYKALVVVVVVTHVMSTWHCQSHTSSKLMALSDASSIGVKIGSLTGWLLLCRRLKISFSRGVWACHREYKVIIKIKASASTKHVFSYTCSECKETITLKKHLHFKITIILCNTETLYSTVKGEGGGNQISVMN